jgi:molybdopterin-containing oxidoreductase family membrane subunit
MSFLVGSFGWFFMWFLLFIKQLPVIAIAEVKEIVPPKLRTAHPHADHIDTSGRHADYEPDTPGEYA